MNKESLLVFKPSDLIASLNQTLDVAYGSFIVEGELSNLRISKSRWVYFDIKDEFSKLTCFGTVYQLPGPVEEGMLVKVLASARLHPRFGFSLNISSLSPTGEGSLKKAADLLKAKLTNEGLFNEDRKRQLPFSPESIALVTAEGSAACADFIKVSAERWPATEINIIDTLVQGIDAPEQLVDAIEYANSRLSKCEIIVITRGGGGADDLAAFNDERLVRAIAASRLPTLVAVGHETDISLAELAADQRASTPSNAAQILLPDLSYELADISDTTNKIRAAYLAQAGQLAQKLDMINAHIASTIQHKLKSESSRISQLFVFIETLSPINTLKKGYAVLRKDNLSVGNITALKFGDNLEAQLIDGVVALNVTGVKNER